jgi:hypothetical protein
VVGGQQKLAQMLDLQGRGHGFMGCIKFGFSEINLS